LAAVRIDLVGTTADFRRFGPQRSLPFNDLPSENPGTAGRIGEVGLGHKKIESTVRYLGIEVDDALAIAEQVDV